jgi:serine/threonine-protein kinase
MPANETWPPDFEPVGILGEGAQGRVFKLRNSGTGQLVAAKRFRWTLDAKLLGRLEREIEVLSRLRHPSIVTFLGVERTASDGFILTELVEGTSLAEIIRTSGGLTAGRALMLGARLADGLAYAASQGVVHRDVKPSNILVCLHDAPKLTDFGSATLGEASKRLTGDGEWVGTPNYMAPEQITGMAVEPRTDVWGLAASLYEAITGRLPFTAETASELAEKVCRADLDVDGLGALVGQPAAQFFAKCMAKQVKDRPEAAEVAVEFARLARRRERERNA